MSKTPNGAVKNSSQLLGQNGAIHEFIRYIPSGDTIPDETWRGRHRNILLLLVAHIPFLLVLGLYSGTESLVTGATIPELDTLHVFGEVSVVVVLAALARWSRFGRRTRTGLATLGLVASSGFLVHFSGGYIEAHFHFFVVMAVVAVYEDWLPFVLGIGYVALQHGIFGMIDPSRVYNHNAAINNPWAWAFIHAAFVLALAAALMSHWYSTERSREEATEQLQQARAKSQEVDDLQAKRTEMEQTIADAEEAKADAEARHQEVRALNDRLEATADAFRGTMDRAADGDLTVRLDADTESDAMAQIAAAFNGMMDETESAMGGIQSFSRDVASTSEQATAGADEARTASEGMSESIQEIAAGAADQQSMLETVSGEMTNLSATVEEVAASAETVAERSRETAEVADDGEQTAHQAIGASEEVQTAIDSTVANVERLDDQMAEIGDIVGLIGDIAEQTNMLALNANIEAARASSGGSGSGDGFAVVADEVKQLAEETQASATEIEQLIEETQSQTETTVTEAREAEQYMRESTEAVENVVDAFTKVAENADATDSGIQEISDTTDDQAATTEETVSMVEEAVDISEATAAETETASATAQEQAGSMSQVSAGIDSIAKQSRQLETMLAKFEVSRA